MRFRQEMINYLIFLLTPIGSPPMRKKKFISTCQCGNACRWLNTFSHAIAGEAFLSGCIPYTERAFRKKFPILFNRYPLINANIQIPPIVCATYEQTAEKRILGLHQKISG
jgi:hypothetical protein